MIECNVWPMNELTKPSGSKTRVMKCKPKDSILRSGISVDKKTHKLVVNPKAIKIKPGLYHLEFKEQGHRYIYCRNAEGKYLMFSKNLNVSKVYAPSEKLNDVIVNLPKMPNGTVVEGELIWPGHPDSEVPTAIKNNPMQLEFVAFACSMYEFISSETLSYNIGRKLLVSLGFDNIAKMALSVNLTPANMHTNITLLLNKANEIEHEGYVLKGMHYNNWWKIKSIHEADVFVTNFKISESKTRKGMVSAINIACYDEKNQEIDMGSITIGNFEESEKLTRAYHKFGTDINNPYMYKTCRILFQEIAGKGKLKHAAFDAWREDKNAEECSFNQFK